MAVAMLERATRLVLQAVRDPGSDTELLSRHIGPRGEIVVIRDADHGFSDHEEELARIIAEWTLA